MNQVIFNMLTTKDMYNKVFDYIDPWGETLRSIALEIRASYHYTIGTTPNQAVFGYRHDIQPHISRVLVIFNH